MKAHAILFTAPHKVTTGEIEIPEPYESKRDTDRDNRATRNNDKPRYGSDRPRRDSDKPRRDSDRPGWNRP